MKVAKIRILKPMDAEWKDLGAAMRMTQQQNASAMNHIMTSMYLYQKDIEAFKTATGKYPTKDEMPVPYLYPELRRPKLRTRSKRINNMNPLKIRATERPGGEKVTCKNPGKSAGLVKRSLNPIILAAYTGAVT